MDNASSSQWQAGDLAACINAGPSERPPSWVTSHRLCAELVLGRVYRVDDVRMTREGVLALRLAGFDYLIRSGNHAGKQMAGFSASRFRKVEPDKHEECEEEFRILLKLSKQRVTA